MQALSDYVSILGTPWGIRKIEFNDDEVPKRLRLFLLSILWRAAATERHEFSEVVLSSDQLEKLRLMVLNGNPEPLAFYPASFVQLSTLGARHNLSPLRMAKQVPAIGKEPAWEEPIFRIFLDGLIIHFSLLSVEEHLGRDLSSLRVGGANSLTINTVQTKDSAEAKKLTVVKMEAELGRPLFEISNGPLSPNKNPFG